jgi:hypothetical protein
MFVSFLAHYLWSVNLFMIYFPYTLLTHNGLLLIPHSICRRKGKLYTLHTQCRWTGDITAHVIKWYGTCIYRAMYNEILLMFTRGKFHFSCHTEEVKAIFHSILDIRVSCKVPPLHDTITCNAVHHKWHLQYVHTDDCCIGQSLPKSSMCVHSIKYLSH